MKTSIGWRRRVSVALATLVGAAGLSVLATAPALAEDLPPQEPGVTMRVFDMVHKLTEICELKASQTPNVDKLMSTIDWSSSDEFGMEDNFLTHVIANLTVPAAGDYTFQLTSDDGSELFIDDELVIDHDGLHGATPKEGTVTLTADHHALRINFIEATGGQQLTLKWKKPGDTTFTDVPDSVLSTDADVVRVTSPGTKECEGQFDSPGDGVPLDSLNPGYDLADLRPEGFEPQVSGLEWMGDDLLVLTWGGTDNVTGKVFKLSGVQEAASPADVTVTEIAAGLREPMGIKVVEGAIYVSQKQELSRLVDADGNGVFEGTDTVASFPYDGNFHEFAFGLLYKEGHFYLNLSVSINYGGATTNPQGSKDRGTHLKINKDTGAIEYVAGGLRTPNGIGWGPEGDAFVTDNQGAWLPANKLVHIKPGNFYNHYTTDLDGDAGRFDDKEPTKPALWMPHNEIANSPSTPVMIPEGPFAGQMWISDVTYGGIQRGFLEKVDGEYQGAYFRMTQGLEAGVNRLLLGPDGTIYAGGLGAGGNWGQEGKLQFGLQKLTPNGTTPFDMVSMKVAEGGFDVTYTHPLSEETLTDLASTYRIKQWTYRPTSQYGGPKVNEETLTVTDATASEDGKTVSIKVDGLKPDRVVHLRSPRPFSSTAGDTLWSTEAWYTLNTYPGYSPEPEPDGLYELEGGEFSGGAVVQSEHASYSGDGYVGGLQDVGSGVEIDVLTEQAGIYDLTLGYANGPNPFDGPKTMSLHVNDEVQQITLASTGGWANYGTHLLEEVPLEEGVNTIRLRHEEGDDGNVNLDYLHLAPSASDRLEAEEATLGGSSNVQSEHVGYSGTGYVGGFNTQGASVRFEADTAEAGQTPLTLGYANGPHPSAYDKLVSLIVNGEKKQIVLPSTGEWTDYDTVTEMVDLTAGTNTIELRVDPGDDGHVNLDYIDVKVSAPPCDPVTTMDDEFTGAALDTCRWNTVLNPVPGGYSVSDGKLHITAPAGDISGGTVSAKNIVLQSGPADDTWTATTQLSLDGTDDYLQAGLVAHTSNNNYAKAVLMRTPQGDWVIELGRRINGESVHVNSPALPAGANQDLQLQMVADGSSLRASYSTDGGATWQSLGAGYPLTGLTEPRIGVAAYNGTGSETASFDRFVVGEPDVEPDTCEPTVADPGYRMLFDGTSASLAEWEMSGPGFFTREDDCTIMTHGGLGLLWHPEPLDGAYSVTMDWKFVADHNSGVFVGFPAPGNDPFVAVNEGYEIQIDASDDPDSTTGAIYNFQASDIAARDAALNPVGEWNSYEILVDENRIRVYLNGSLVNDFTSADPNRMKWPSFVGLQNHGGGENVYFRDVQLKELADPENVAATVGVTPTPAEVGVGDTAEVEVEVTAEGVTPTGEVTLRDGDTTVGTATLTDGVASFTVGPYDSAGSHTLTASYAGDVAVDPGEGTAELTVTAKPEPPADPLTIVSSARSQCVGGQAMVAVHARNDGPLAVDIRLTTEWGDQKWSQVAPGKAVYKLFASGKKKVAAGSATVAAYVWLDGKGYYDRQSVSYSAIRCNDKRSD